MPGWVVKLNWVVFHIRVPVIAFGLGRVGDDAVRLDEPPQSRVIPPCHVIIESNRGLGQLAGIVVLSRCDASRRANLTESGVA